MKVRLSLFVLASLLMAGLAHAQSTMLQVNVPFQFRTGNKVMPAGAYVIQSAGVSGDRILILRGSDNDTALLNTIPAESMHVPDQSKLTFRCYSKDQCFLSQIWIEGNSTGRELTKSHKERVVAKQQTEEPTRRAVAASGTTTTGQ